MLNLVGNRDDMFARDVAYLTREINTCIIER